MIVFIFYKFIDGRILFFFLWGGGVIFFIEDFCLVMVYKCFRLIFNFLCFFE